MRDEREVVKIAEYISVCGPFGWFYKCTNLSCVCRAKIEYMMESSTNKT